jgi:hypothetical protein
MTHFLAKDRQFQRKPFVHPSVILHSFCLLENNSHSTKSKLYSIFTLNVTHTQNPTKVR